MNRFPELGAGMKGKKDMFQQLFGIAERTTGKGSYKGSPDYAKEWWKPENFTEIKENENISLENS